MNTGTARECITHDSFLTDAYGAKGFSGGIFTCNGEFAGIATYIAQTKSNAKLGAAGGAKAARILGLIRSVAYSLGKIYQGR